MTVASKNYLCLVKNALAAAQNEVKKKATAIIESVASHELAWGDTMFLNAAKCDTLSQIISGIEDGQPLDVILSYLENNLSYLTATANNFSTSPCANLMNQHRTAVLHHEIEQLRRVIKHQSSE